MRAAGWSSQSGMSINQDVPVNRAQPKTNYLCAIVKKLPLEVQHDALVPSGRCKGKILKNDIFFWYMHKFLNQHDSGMLTV